MLEKTSLRVRRPLLAANYTQTNNTTSTDEDLIKYGWDEDVW